MHPIGININYNFLACLVLFLASRPKLKELLVMGAAGAILSPYIGFHGTYFHKALEALSYCGAGAIPAVWLMPLTSKRSDLKLLGKLAVPPAFGILSSMLLEVGAHGITFDNLLYAFDGSLGFQPSFWAGRTVAITPWFSAFTRGLYDGLPLFLVIAYVLQERRSGRQARDLFFLMMLIGICGAACFLIFPAVGAYFLFARSFPFNPPPLSSITIVPAVVVETVPRNCMPSLHTAWALAVFWTARRFSLPWRLALRGLLVLMLLQTLVFHYLIDMVVAVPFTLALYAAVQTTVPWSAPQRRYTCLMGALLVATWMIVLRWGIPLFLTSPAVPWTAALVTIISSCYAWRKLERATELLGGAGQPARGSQPRFEVVTSYANPV